MCRLTSAIHGCMVVCKPACSSSCSFRLGVSGWAAVVAGGSGCNRRPLQRRVCQCYQSLQQQRQQESGRRVCKLRAGRLSVPGLQDFYTRRMFYRIHDAFNRPICSSPDSWIDVMERTPVDGQKCVGASKQGRCATPGRAVAAAGVISEPLAGHATACIFGTGKQGGQ